MPHGAKNYKLIRATYFTRLCQWLLIKVHYQIGEIHEQWLEYSVCDFRIIVASVAH